MEKLDALVVGAGFAGLYQIHRLREKGLNVRCVDIAQGVGGTWYWNRYPGARCDVESMTYSYSFSPELEQEWTWSEKYATQEEILRYLNHVADKYGLRQYIEFGRRVIGARYDQVEHCWNIKLDQEEQVSAQFLIMATGCLSVPKDPEILGIENFGGSIVYTSRWPEEGINVKGLKVGVIGTGSSGIQSIPLLASEADSVVVFQRTAAYSLPAGNRPLTPQEVTNRKLTYRSYRLAARESLIGNPVEVGTQSALSVSEEERNATYEAAWQKGNLVSILLSYTDLLTDEIANETAADFIRNKIRHIVKSKSVADTLCPYTFPFGTKRPCLDTNYYSTFNQDNVELIDIRRYPIEAITKSGVRTSLGEREFDVLVFATGFDAMTGALTKIDIIGKDGVDLRSEWRSGPVSYLGLMVVGFPNLFTITGPLSPSVLTNMVVSIEQHVDWITDCIAGLKSRGAMEIAAEKLAQKKWVAHVQEIAKATLFPSADSWYTGANVEGKAKGMMVYTAGVKQYREECEEIVSDNYRGFIVK